MLFILTYKMRVHQNRRLKLKKTALIVLAVTVAFFAVSIGFFLLKGEKTLTKDEAIALVDFKYAKSSENKNFSTDKETYKNNEQITFYKDGEPFIGWKFSKVTTESYDDTEGFPDLGKSGMVRLELEVENFNYNHEPYNPFFSFFTTVFVTDKGIKLIEMANLPFTPLEVGEKNTYVYFIETERATKKLDKIYIRYYYANDFLNASSLPPKNHVDFELEVSH